MHEFRTLLIKVIRENRWTQNQLAGKLNADQATVSRILSGRVQMKSTTLGKLLKVVPTEQRGLLLEAYLRDEIPNGCDHLVELKSATGEGVILEDSDDETSPEFPKTIDAELKKRLVFMSNVAINSPDVRKVIDVVYRLVNKGRR